MTPARPTSTRFSCGGWPGSGSYSGTCSTGCSGVLGNLALLAAGRGDLDAAETGYREIRTGWRSATARTAGTSTRRCRVSPGCSPGQGG